MPGRGSLMYGGRGLLFDQSSRLSVAGWADRIDHASSTSAKNWARNLSPSSGVVRPLSLWTVAARGLGRLDDLAAYRLGPLHDQQLVLRPLLRRQ
ncbi:hypothetical protein [Streptomyces avermitilis]|uniref:hypothetical protein n=1 Tax=Streptomyces avermitilis TaxID=33903 RepID=UPI003720FD30